MIHICPKPPYCPQCATMSASEAAQALSISRNTYYRRVKDGTIKPFRVGLGRMRVKRSEVDKILEASRWSEPFIPTQSLESALQLLSKSNTK